MTTEHQYPDFAFLEVDEVTNEKRWFSSKGMGVQYIHEDRAAEDIAAAIAAEREACAKISDAHETAVSDQCWQTAKAIAAAIRARGTT